MKLRPFRGSSRTCSWPTRKPTELLLVSTVETSAATSPIVSVTWPTASTRRTTALSPTVNTIGPRTLVLNPSFWASTL